MTPQHAFLPHRPRPARRRSPARPGERGSASIQMVVLLPALFAVMFLGLQAALSYHARTIALAAASEGARAAAAEHGTTTVGTKAAASYLADTGGDALTGTKISARRTPSAATVSVAGVALSVVPGWSPAITASATVPVERLTR